MRRRFAASLIGLLLVSCGSVPETYYYLIHYDTPNPRHERARYPVSLELDRLEASSLYRDDRLVYRDSPYQVKFYHYRRWVSPPDHLVTDQALVHLTASNLFQRVSLVPFGTDASYLLKGSILQFEEWDEGDAWYGRVTLEFELVRKDGGDSLWKERFTKSTVVAEKTGNGVVQALSESLKSCLDGLVDKLAAGLPE